MPLTGKEFRQIRIALEVMHGYNINGQVYVPEKNVLALVSRWVEEEGEPRREEPPGTPGARGA